VGNGELDEQGKLLGIEILNGFRFLRTAIGSERLIQFAHAGA